MKSITIHNLTPALDKSIRSRAKKTGLSLNKTIKQLLENALGISVSKTRKKNDFSKYWGVWSKQEAEEIERAMTDQERIDPEVWK